MGDIAQILAPTAATVPSISSSNDSAKAVKLAGMSDDTMYLMKGKQDPSSASLPPVIPTFSKIAMASADKDGTSPTDGDKEVKVKVGSKLISSSKRARPWTWAPFASSSRTDGAIFRHWVRKNVEYTDYPYAKFDVHLDPVIYTPEEYEVHLQSDTWTKSETDRLMELARIFECRWPVIFDRFCFENNNSGNLSSENKTDDSSPIISGRKIEDLQHRYYGVAATLSQLRISHEAASEARALSVAAAKAAATPSHDTATSVSTLSSASAGAAGKTNGTSVATQKRKSDHLLLESAAARSLATSAKQHQPLMTHVGTGTSNKMFDYEKEHERRQHLDRLWRRSKEEEEEEVQLRKELKAIDAQLRKLKKHGGHVLAAGSAKIGVRTAAPASRGAPAEISNASSSRGPSRSATPIPAGTSSSATQGDAIGSNESNINSEIVENPDVLDEYFASTAPVPMSQYPYLQSGRLAPPANGGSGGINKSLLLRMNEVLKELNVPEKPLPTKRVCDMYDLVRKDALTLLTLKKMLMQREGQLQSKRLRLTRMGGSMVTPDDRVLDEERLLGISPPPKPSSSAAGNSPATKAKTAKRKSPGGAAAKTKTAAKKAVPDTKAAATTAVKKKTVKRKRKADTSKSPTAASSGAASKSPAPGSAAAKAAKARTPSAVGSKPTGQTSAGTATSVAAKGSTAVAAAAAIAREKANGGSAAKRSRKS